MSKHGPKTKPKPEPESNPKPEPEPETIPKQRKEQLTTEDQALQMASDWEESTTYPGLQHSPSTNQYWCQKHDKLGGPGGQSQHWKKYHSTESFEAARKIYQKVTSAAAKEETADLSEYIMTKPENMILYDMNKEVADSVAMLGKDPELRFEFDQLVFQKMIPRDWNYYSWIKKCISFWNKSFGISCTLDLDEKVLSEQQKEWLKDTVQENLKISDIEAEAEIT